MHDHISRGWKLIGTSAVLSAALVLSACSSGQEPPPGPATGGTAVIALPQEPGMLSPMFTRQSGATLSYAFVIEPLFTTHANGTRTPNLASEVPTVQNGMVSEDGRTVRYEIKEGITWSDGEAFTADDLAFTVEVAQNPDAAVTPDSDYAAIASVKVIDETSIEITFSEPSPTYLGLFQQPLPEHAFSTTAPGPEDPQARMPLGTGPFVYTEWKSGDEIQLKRNENYWRQDEQPLLDGIVIKVTPDAGTAVSGLNQGDFDLVYGLPSGSLVDIQRAVDGGADVVIEKDLATPGFVEWLWVNNSDSGDLSTPHPVLGDPAVREAIDYAIDRKAIISDVLGGFGTLSNSLIYAGFGGELVDPVQQDPAHAQQLLDESGWVLGDDGVRVKDGVRASVLYQTIAGDQTRVLYQQIIQQNLADVGIEVKIENVPSDTLFGARADGGLLATGNFDLSMSRAGRSTDPYEWVEVLTTENIPVEDGATGYSYTWWSNARFDELVHKLGTEIDPELRLGYAAEINELFSAARPAIPLYASPTAWAWSSKLQGVSTDSWRGPWDTALTRQWNFSSTN